jgi:phosphoenolpyruvate carboxykinase (diphosphate)
MAIVLQDDVGLSQSSATHAAPARSKRSTIHRYIHLKLLALGLPGLLPETGGGLAELTGSLLANYRQKTRLLTDYRCPVDRRVEDFLQQQCASLNLPQPLRLPSISFNLDQAGLGRELSLPPDRDTFESPLLNSYRVRNGVLHNPRSDRRTTKGTFHIAEGGLPIPADKIAVPLAVFAKLFQHAVNPPKEFMVLPFTAVDPTPSEVFCSLLLRPIVCPEIPGIAPQKTMEVRFFAPGSLVSNLDFVEIIFGNAGDPVLPENDAGLDAEHWSGHTGCVILAPHLVSLTKAELGLPHFDQATPRQQRDGMCWKTKDECYNGGQAFKITCRSAAGVIVTLIADNYYGYCKKEVKTQISFAANLFGNVEEEHSGGAIAFPSYSLGDEFRPTPEYSNNRTFEQVVQDYGDVMNVHPDGYGIDRKFPNLIYVSEDARMDVRSLSITWTKDGHRKTLPLLVDKIYLTPSGQKIYLNKHPWSERFRLVVTVPEGTFCHKPCTVSGGGKSEISKSLLDYMIYGPIFVTDLAKDLDQVELIFSRDHARRWKAGKEPHDYASIPSRPILSPKRSLGSVIKLLTPSTDYTDAYNKWLSSIPSNILAMVFLIKRLYKPEWGEQWREHFSVDIVNGEPGHELKVEDRPAAGTYLRVGLLANQAWRTYKLRQDFFPSAKVQMEDDITASVVVPQSQLPKSPNALKAESVKLAINTEQRLFQRPDDAIHPGLDKQTEADMARSDNFLSNFEPLNIIDARNLVDRITEFDQYSPPMKQLLAEAARDGRGLVVSSAHPRLVNGKPSKNPRYLQERPDLMRPIEPYLAQMGLRLWRGIPASAPLPLPVDAVLVGRRSNPPDAEAGIRSLAVYSPIHYQELPELFMDFICSLTGKSPSTTGAGSEGALTKGPFNALSTTADLNAALISYILTGLGGFSSVAGYVGPTMRVGHDISLLIPELWCRLTVKERDPAYLIAHGYLEKLNDFDYQGQKIPASRLGYRITYHFVRAFFGRMFDNPAKVFDEAMLRPEIQDKASFADGVLNIAQAQEGVAKMYFEDGSVAQACPPLRALLHIMAHGQYEGKDASHPDIRAMFTRDYLISSDWYQERLRTKQERDVALWRRHVQYLTDFSQQAHQRDVVEQLNLASRLAAAQQELARVSSDGYLATLVGTLGADPMR